MRLKVGLLFTLLKIFTIFYYLTKLTDWYIKFNGHLTKKTERSFR